MVQWAMKFNPLTVLHSGDDLMWVAGAEHATRSDGSSSLMVAQTSLAYGDYPAGKVMMDDVGQEWCLTADVAKGFNMNGIVLEEREYYERNTK